MGHFAATELAQRGRLITVPVVSRNAVVRTLLVGLQFEVLEHLECKNETFCLIVLFNNSELAGI